MAACLGWLAAAVAALGWWRAARRAGRSNGAEVALAAAGPSVAAGERGADEALGSADAEIAAERERIYSDLHDDLGARLLQLVYEATDPRQADLARAVLQDLRDVVSRSRGVTGDLEQVLGEIRREATQRLSGVGATLLWEQADALPQSVLPQRKALHLYRIVREAISNALRHAEARRLRMRIRASGGRLDLELTDDGAAAGLDADVAGSGMRGMRARADALQGDIAWLPGTEGGTKVLLSIPLAAGEGTAPPHA